jgi:hypothetical protein
MAGGQEKLVSGRVHGVREARLAAAEGVAGWPVYNDDGPAGLHPERYYVVRPGTPRPAVYFRTNNKFAPGLYEAYVHDGYLGEHSAWLDLRPLESLHNITRYDNVVLVSPQTPKQVWVNDQPATPIPVEGKAGQWQINIELPATVAVLFADAPASLAESLKQAHVRCVSSRSEQRSDWTRPEFARTFLVATDKGWKLDIPAVVPMRTQAFIPLRLLGSEAGAYKIKITCPVTEDRLGRVLVNGSDQAAVCRAAGGGGAEITVPLTPAQPQAILGIEATYQVTATAEWLPAAAKP